MRPFLFIVLSTVFIVCGSCHTRKVSSSRIDSLAKKEIAYQDLSTTTTHLSLDTALRFPAHRLVVPPYRLYKPFTFQDSAMEVSVDYDSIRGLVYVAATEKAKVVMARIQETIVKQNKILATIKTEVKVDKKAKDSKSSGIPFGAYILFALVALFVGYKFLKK